MGRSRGQGQAVIPLGGADEPGYVVAGRGHIVYSHVAVAHRIPREPTEPAGA